MYSLVAAFTKADAYVGIQKYIAISPDQQKFLDFMEANQKALAFLPEIESIATESDLKINRFLRRHGSNIELKPFKSETFGIATSLQILVKWKEKAETTEVKANKTTYPGIKISKGLSFFNVPGHKNPVIRIETQANPKIGLPEYFWVTVDDSQPNFFNLTEKARLLMRNIGEELEYNQLIMPMIDLSHQFELTWLKGLRFIDKRNRNWMIDQAQQQNILKLNEYGAKGASSTAVSAVRSIAPAPSIYTINQPFTCWFSRGLLANPTIVYRCDYNCWKNPGNIG